MLLQKTGWRIKQFISHRKNYSADDSGKDISDGHLGSKKNRPCGSKRLSWLSQASSSENLGVQRTSSNATTPSKPLLPASTTGSSLATSLCSLDCDARAVSIQHSLSPVGTGPTSPDILCLPISTSPGIANRAKTWRLILSKEPSLPPASPISATSATESTFDLLEALAINLEDEDETSTQSLRSSVVSDAEYVSKNVEQLIRETDKAFQPGGPALTFVKSPTQARYETATIAPATPRTAAQRQVLQKQPTLLVSSTNTPILLPMGKRRTHDKRKMSPMDQPVCLNFPPRTTTPATWTLADVAKNVVDTFSGKVFRGKGDDILRPGFVQRIREGAEVESGPKVSMESDRLVEDDQRTETSSLESMSPRVISIRGKSSPLSSQAHYPPALSKPGTPYTSTRLSQPQRARFTGTSSNDASMVFKHLNFPSPPRMPNSRSEIRNSLVLSTIPEVEPLSITQSLYSGYHEPSRKPSSDYFDLPSTTFTLTSPLFRHGPIRLERSLSQGKDLSPDESLDWTAFHMAISGAIDDHDLYEDLWPSEADEAELDDLMDWWTGLGIQNTGSSVRGPSECTKSTGEENSTGLGVNCWKAEVPDRQSMNRERISDIGSCNVEMTQDMTAESLPPSPMVNLVDLVSNSDEVVPMGYNLGHDLGDYLNWETQYV